MTTERHGSTSALVLISLIRFFRPSIEPSGLNANYSECAKEYKLGMETAFFGHA
jgi:hypothetical protein